MVLSAPHCCTNHDESMEAECTGACEAEKVKSFRLTIRLGCMNYHREMRECRCMLGYTHAKGMQKRLIQTRDHS